jgi:RNA polymerase sigma factor (sigma-70 family)
LDFRGSQKPTRCVVGSGTRERGRPHPGAGQRAGGPPSQVHTPATGPRPGPLECRTAGIPMNVFESSTGVREILLQIREGEASATDRLFAHCLGRFKLLSRRIFSTRKDLHGFEESDDLLQEALIRLNGAVTKLQPASTRALMTLALQHIRWALGDLARELRRKARELPIPDPGAVPANTGPTGEPHSLFEWQSFHEIVEQLPADEKQVFDAVFYGGASREEVAEMLGISTRTVKRRWRSARLLLHEKLRGDWPPIG